MLRRFSEPDSGVKCPACESEEVRRMVSSFAASFGTTSAGGGCDSGGGGRRFG